MIFKRHNGLCIAESAALLLAALAMAIGLAMPAAAAPDDGQWDPTLPKIVSSGAKFLSSLGLGGGGGGASQGAVMPGGRVRGPQAIEYAIRRGASQMGVPYSWGGGTLTGPGPGVDDDAGKIGFDCSGFTRYMFAGVGVQIPKYSGDQFNTGRPIAPSQAKRGDLIFYGPGGSQHVAIYLGGGRMLEASGSAGKVTVSPVRTAGMSPHLSRMIES